MRRFARYLLLVAVLAGPIRAEDVVVFAAASLETALGEIAPGFATATGHRMVVSSAGSSQLARQILMGAPADVFLSANAAWMDALEAEGRLVPGTRFDLLGNRLVLVAHDPDAAAIDLEEPGAVSTRLGSGHLAMALVDSVPAGIYGKTALTALGQWSAVASRVAQTDNVRAALALVATGAAPLGIVYLSDAIAEPRVTVVATFPDSSQPPIVYPVAIVAGRDLPGPQALIDHLKSPSARAVFEAQGFSWVGE